MAFKTERPRMQGVVCTEAPQLTPNIRLEKLLASKVRNHLGSGQYRER
jgi:hypothetical protein